MESIRKTLIGLKEAHLYRRLKTVDSPQSAKLTLAGREYISLSSNNYLGLASDKRVVAAAKAALDKYGFGASASRLISGTMSPHTKLERGIAKFKKTEAAILYNSGYCANLGLISALAGKNDIILGDKLNHASIIDASKMSNAKVRRYPHKDMATLEKFLQDSKNYSQRIIITDGVFSMDGDIAPLKKIIKLAKKHDALVIVDDAHATGVLGKSGSGTMEHLGIDDDNVIQMGTLSKALGCFGAFVAGRKELIEFLINKSRPFIYTTALPPSTAAAAVEALKIVQREGALREKLFDNVNYLRNKLISAGLSVLNSESHIIAVLIGSAKKALDLSRRLLEHGVFIQAIRPPTVPKGTSRLRITPTAGHTKEELEYAFDVMMRFFKNRSGSKY